MAKVMRLMFTLLAIPAIAFVAAQVLLVNESREWHKAFEQTFSEIRQPTPAQSSARRVYESATATKLCSTPAFRALDQDFEKACSEDVDPLSMMNKGSEIAAVMGVGLILMIAVFGSIVNSSRTLLVVVFLPGLYLRRLGDC